MTVRFLADEDVDSDIIQGLRSREPAIDILDVKTPDCEERQIRGKRIDNLSTKKSKRVDGNKVRPHRNERGVKMKERMIKETKERDVRTHADLWFTSGFFLKSGQAQETGSFHQFMASLVFTAFTFEAYLNWLGMKLFPHWSYLERLSPNEKLKLVADVLSVKVAGVRPWQTIKPLFGFRNDIAHGKPETLTESSVHQIDGYLSRPPQMIKTEWEKFCTRENAERAREDVEKILGILHSAANLEDDLGPLQSGMESGWTTLEVPDK